MSEEIETRRCIECLEDKPLVKFYPAKAKQSQQKCRKCIQRKSAGRCRDTEAMRVYNHEYYLANKDKLREQRREWDRKHRKGHGGKWYKKVRDEVLAAYGKMCKCCGETEPNFLVIDHIYGGGNLHRRTVGKQNVYNWIRQNNYPEGFQVLCHNCNMAKGFYGECPHERHKLVALAAA